MALLNDGKHIQNIMLMQDCNKHKADKGMACWAFESSMSNIIIAVCNKRAIRAGANGKVTASSYQQKNQETKTTRRYKNEGSNR